MNDILFLTFLREQEKALAHIELVLHGIDGMPDSEEKCEEIYTTIELCRLNADYNGRKELSIKGLTAARAIESVLYELYFLESLAASLFHLGNYDEAFTLFMDLLHKSSDDAFRAKAYNGMGCVCTELDNFELAIEYHEKALEIREKNNLICEILQSYNNLSYAYYRNKDFDKSIDIAVNGIMMAEKHKEPGKLAYLYHNLGSVYRQQFKIDDALDCFMLGLEYAKNANDRHCAGQILCCMGLVHLDMENPEDALVYLTESLRIAEISNCCVFLATNYRALSQTYRMMGDYEKTLEFRDRYDALTDIIHPLKKSHTVHDRINSFHVHLFEQEKEVFRLKNNELISAFNSMEQKNKDLMQLNTYKDYILNIAVHDLRNTVGQIQSIHQLVTLLKIDHPLLQRYCDMGAKAVAKSQDLIDSILNAYQIEHKSFSLSARNADFSEVVADVLDIYTTIAVQKNISLHISLPEAPVHITLEKTRFVQIIDNLLSNAIKFTAKNGSVSFSAMVLADIKRLQITVADTGIGIPQQHLPVIFEQFTAARRKGTEGEATTGLGMSIVKKLVELHNGTITIDSQVNVGTTVTLFFPLT